VKPVEAEREVAMAAGQMLSGDIDVLTFACAFNGLLGDLCEDEPLGGDLLELFFAFETLEKSFGAKRVGAVENLKQVAQRLASTTPPWNRHE
jgi:hypothetical protein